MIRITPYASGSTGNLYTITDGQSTLMLECGVRINFVIKHINIDEIDGCLISHEHQDHAKCLRELLGHCVPCYSAKETFQALDCHLRDPFVYFLHPGEMIEIETFQVIPFKVEHDAKNPLGFYIKSTVTNETLLFATDTYYIGPRFGTVNYLMIEANYDKELLEESVTNGKVDARVAYRIMHSHFELSNVVKFIESLDKSQLKEVMLIHLSEHNAQSEYFLDTIRAVVPNCTVSIAPRIVK